MKTPAGVRHLGAGLDAVPLVAELLIATGTYDKIFACGS